MSVPGRPAAASSASSTGAAALSGGWDSIAVLVDGRWIERTPRRRDFAGQLRMETRLMPWLAPQLPLPVPQPFMVRAEPVTVRHELIIGDPIARFDAANGTALGTFLRVLHGVDVDHAVALGVPAASVATRSLRATLDRFRHVVVPLIPAHRRLAALRLLDKVGAAPADAVTHSDLGPDHVLARDGQLSGVIDWADTRVSDPAVDLAWAVHGTPAEFAGAVGAAYGSTPALRERARCWHRLGPWFEVTHGIDGNEPAWVQSGLRGLLRRL